MVSGEGLREGIAFLAQQLRGARPGDVKQASVAGLASRFRAGSRAGAPAVSAAEQLVAMLALELPDAFHAVWRGPLSCSISAAASTITIG